MQWVMHLDRTEKSGVTRLNLFLGSRMNIHKNAGYAAWSRSDRKNWSRGGIDREAGLCGGVVG